LEGGGQGEEDRRQKTEDREIRSTKYETRNKYEIRNTKYETNSKFKCSNEQNGEVQR